MPHIRDLLHFEQDRKRNYKDCLLTEDANKRDHTSSPRPISYSAKVATNIMLDFLTIKLSE